MVVVLYFPGLTEMRAVKEQREKFWQLSSDFAQRLKFHLFAIFQQHVSFVGLCFRGNLLCAWVSISNWRTFGVICFVQEPLL